MKNAVPAFVRSVPAAVLALVLLLLAAPAGSALSAGRGEVLFPPPATASPEFRACVSRTPRPGALEIAEAMKGEVRIGEETVAGVPCYVLTPENPPAEAAGRVVLELHGGAYVHGAGIGGVKEGLLTARFTGMKVVHPDYRLAPEHPFPAALDDAEAVYRELLKTHPADRIGLIGTSAGGGLCLALTLRLKAEGLPLPGAVVAGTPWTDLQERGDTYHVNAGVDDVVVRGSGGRLGRRCAGDRDLADPLVSPVHGDFSGFPPTLLGSGTRDLLLSDTVRVHRKMREAGVQADLVVVEGLSHAEYILPPDVPETIYYYGQVRAFYERNLR